MTFLRANWVLVLLLAATLLVLVVLAIVVSAARRGSGPAGDGAAVETRSLLGANAIRLSFRRAVQLIEANLASGAERYNLAWTLLLNDSADADVPMAQAGLRSALSERAAMPGQQGIAWHFFDKGVVVQVRTQLLGAEEGGGTWDTFLALCRSYRPQRPFDAIVLAIPCAALLDLEPAGQLALTARAQALHRRLWLAQNRLALRFPVHLVITECERIPGFARFGAAVPEPLRRAILGWASPYELVAPYRDQWADSAVDQVTGAVADTCAELSALEEGRHDSSDYLLLPNELERLRTGLKAFCEELMRPSAYHESFLLRGIYLTGDSSPAALLQAPAAGADAGGMAPVTPEDSYLPMPVFLRDIFERKVFAEVGLVRTSRQRLRQPAARRVGYWLALLVPLAWGIGIGVGTYGLSQKKDDLVDWLVRENRRAAPGETASSPPRGLRNLAAVEEMAALRFVSLAIPGSWPLFNDVDEKIQNRLNRDFARVLVTELRAAAVKSMDALTGADYTLTDTGATGSRQCDLSRRLESAVKAAPLARLDLGSFPEYKVLLKYLDDLRQLDLAFEAMRRLRAPGRSPPSAADLATAMRVLLKRSVPDQFTNAAALYSEAAADDATGTSSKLPEEFLTGAARCATLSLATSMYEQLFEYHPLLRAEQQINKAYADLRQRDTMEAAWRGLQVNLSAEQTLLARGGGAWMYRGALELGPAQDELLKRIRNNRLLGRDVEQETLNIASMGFAGFQTAWATALGGSGEDGSYGLVWDENSWKFTPVRKKLVDSVAEMFAPTYMQPSSPRRLPAPQRDRTVRWDKTQLDKVNALIEARTTFLAGPYTKLPVSLQEPAGELVAGLLVKSIQNALAQAAVPGDPAMPSAAADAERANVLAIRGWLNDLGQADLVGEIDALLGGDALVRLGRLDAAFIAAQLYLPGDPGFQHWQGRKGVMVDAFGDGDLAALNVYLDQQKEFVDTIGSQAEGVVNELVSVTPPGAAGPVAALIARWQALGTDLARYRQKSPASSRLALENFIRTGGADLDLTNCAARLGPLSVSRTAPDFFAARLQALQQSLLARCRFLAGDAGQRQWQLFAEAWNRDVGGRMTFTGAGQPGELAAPADRETVGAVLKLYDSAQEAGRLYDGMQDAGKLPGRAPYRDAVQLRRVRDLLAPLYPADSGQVAGLDVAVAFRENRGAERSANQIVDWALTVGSSTLHMGEPPRALRWEPGLPVSLALRFARDGGSVPVADPARPGMTVEHGTVTFRFTDPWALFTFVSAYRDSDVPGDDGRAALLRLAFQLAPAEGMPGAADGGAIVFLRLKVSAPGTFKPLPWPGAIGAPLPLTLETVKNNL